MEFISLPFRPEFRKFYIDLVSHQIDDSCQRAGIKPRKIPSDHMLSGEWRTRAEEYYESLDWTNPMDVERFLLPTGLVLSLAYISQK
jgi:hypothetical protein